MIYLSGKITDTTKGAEQKNIKRFYDKAEELRKLGCDIYNPCEHEDGGKKWEEYLAQDVLSIIKGDMDIYMMKGWEDSEGAKLELEVVKLLGNEIHYEV